MSVFTFLPSIGWLKQAFMAFVKLTVGITGAQIKIEGIYINAGG
jgi:hypothetical protein